MKPLLSTSEGDIYEVFARFRDETLHHVGTVIALDSDLAQVYAARLYDEWRWNEMMIVRRADVVPIVSQSEFKPTLDLKQPNFKLFGRKEYPTPLGYLGEITAPSVDSVPDTAFAQVGSDGWIELTAIPSEHTIEVLNR